MPALPAELYYAEIDASTAALAALADRTGPGLAIPACPGWTLRQLVTHLGRAQRWAAEIVRTRSAEFIEFRAVPDARLAAGEEVSLPPELAADAIDEWLTVMSGPISGRPDPRLQALPPGRSLQVHATDPGLASAGEWLIRHANDGIQVTAEPAEPGKADAALSGTATDVLLVLAGRKPAAGPAVRVAGDHDLLSTWLKEISF
jgi:MDMPI C-terminal domain/Mycothiol maleylpyruvate isomerase N-terminal domain